MDYYKTVLKKYAVFTGRASRAEYWYFVLFNSIAAVLAIILDYVLGIEIKGSGAGPIYIIYLLAVIVPSIAVGVRRLHDVGKSGWMYFISLIPIVGGIWLLVLFIKKGDPAENKYGPIPVLLSLSTSAQPVSPSVPTQI